MNKTCKKVQILLSLYIEDTLEEQEKELVSSHLSDCLECQHELKQMQKTIDSLHLLEKIKAPKDFLINVQQKLSSKSFLKKFKEIIFFPFYLENITPFASILAVLVLVVFLQKTNLHKKVNFNSMKDMKRESNLPPPSQTVEKNEETIATSDSDAIIEKMTKNILSKPLKRSKASIITNNLIKKDENLDSLEKDKSRATSNVFEQKKFNAPLASYKKTELSKESLKHNIPHEPSTRHEKVKLDFQLEKSPNIQLQSSKENKSLGISRSMEALPLEPIETTINVSNSQANQMKGANTKTLSSKKAKPNTKSKNIQAVNPQLSGSSGIHDSLDADIQEYQTLGDSPKTIASEQIAIESLSELTPESKISDSNQIEYFQDEEIEEDEIEEDEMIQKPKDIEYDQASQNKDAILKKIKKEVNIANGKIIKIEKLAINKQLIEIEIPTSRYEEFYHKLQSFGVITTPYQLPKNRNLQKARLSVIINYK